MAQSKGAQRNILGLSIAKQTFAIFSLGMYGATHICIVGGMYAYKPYTGECRVKFLVKSTGDSPVFAYQQTSDGIWDWNVDEFLGGLPWIN